MSQLSPDVQVENWYRKYYADYPSVTDQQIDADAVKNFPFLGFDARWNDWISMRRVSLKTSQYGSRTPPQGPYNPASKCARSQVNADGSLPPSLAPPPRTPRGFRPDFTKSGVDSVIADMASMALEERATRGAQTAVNMKTINERARQLQLDNPGQYGRPGARNGTVGHVPNGWRNAQIRAAALIREEAGLPKKETKEPSIASEMKKRIKESEKPQDRRVLVC